MSEQNCIEVLGRTEVSSPSPNPLRLDTPVRRCSLGSQIGGLINLPDWVH